MGAQLRKYGTTTSVSTFVGELKISRQTYI